MNPWRSLFWLTFAAVALALAWFAFDARSDAASQGALRPFLLRDADSAIRLDIVGAGNASLSLEKDGKWRVKAPFRGAADETAVNRLLDALAFTEAQDALSTAEIERNGGSLGDFGLLRPRLSVEVGWSGRSSRVSFGNPTPGGEGVYAAIPGFDGVVVCPTNVLSSAGAKADAFRSHELLDADAGDVVAFDVKRGSGSFARFEKSGSGWAMREPQSSEVSAQRVRDLLLSTMGAKVGDFLWPVGASNEAASASLALLSGYGLDPENAVSVTFKFANGDDKVASFGRDAGNGQVFVLAQNGAAVATAAASLKEALMAEAESFVDNRLFKADASSVSWLSVADGETRYLLARGEGGAWRLDSPVAAPASQDAANALVAKLLSMKTADLVKEGLLVSVSQDASPVCVSRKALLGDFRLEDLRATEILSIDAALVKRVVVTPSGAAPTAVVFDQERGSWNVETSPGSGVADKKAIDRLLAALSPLRARRIEKLKVSVAELGLYGLETPRLAVAVDQAREGAVRRNVLIGDKTEGGRFATLASSDAVFVVSDGDVAAFSSSLLLK